jgi:hypothetical protein
MYEKVLFIFTYYFFNYFSGMDKLSVALTNSVIKGYQAFQIKVPVNITLSVFKEYGNLYDKCACLVYMPESVAPREDEVFDVTRPWLKLGQVAGLPVGHVPRGLADILWRILNDGLATITW